MVALSDMHEHLTGTTFFLESSADTHRVAPSELLVHHGMQCHQRPKVLMPGIKLLVDEVDADAIVLEVVAEPKKSLHVSKIGRASCRERV